MQLISGRTDFLKPSSDGLKISVKPCTIQNLGRCVKSDEFWIIKKIYPDIVGITMMYVHYSSKKSLSSQGIQSLDSILNTHLAE